MAIEEEPFDAILSLEDDYYKEGYDLGVSDGDRAGRVEGRWFGLEKGFEKYVAMGKLHGKAMIWSGRLPDTVPDPGSTILEGIEGEAVTTAEAHPIQGTTESSSQDPGGHAPRLSSNTRLENHVRTLYALTESGSISTENNEDSVSDFDDRLKRAEGKVKILEKLTRECNYEDTNEQPPSQDHNGLAKDFTSKKGDGSIEDISSLHVRH